MGYMLQTVKEFPRIPIVVANYLSLHAICTLSWYSGKDEYVDSDPPFIYILLHVSTYIVWWGLFIENNQLSIVATISNSIQISWLRDSEDVTQIPFLICWNILWLVNPLMLCLRQRWFATNYVQGISGTPHPSLDFRKSKYFCRNGPFKDHGFERLLKTGFEGNFMKF